MRYNLLNKFFAAGLLVAVTSLAIPNGFAADATDTSKEGEGEGEKAKAKPIDPADKTAKIVAMLEAQMNAPLEKRIPETLLGNARCVALIPEMIQLGVGVGGKHGSGVMACRHEETNKWGAPVFVRLSGANVGTQLGIQKVDVILLAMTDNGLNQLLSGKPVVSGDAGVSVGPIGRNAEIAMDVLLQTPLLSYTRSKGLYAGATVGGSVFTTAKKVNHDLYGNYENVRDVLLKRGDVPEAVQPVRDALTRFSAES